MKTIWLEEGAQRDDLVKNTFQEEAMVRTVKIWYTTILGSDIILIAEKFISI